MALPRTLSLFLLLALAGCQHRIAPPREVSDPVTVFIVDYGRHAGLAIPDESGQLTEWFWGDWDYFARGDTSILSGLRALFASRGATLGRLALRGRTAAEVLAETGAEKVVPVRVERSRAEALSSELSARYARRRASEIVQPGGRRFVRDDTPYSLTHNSTQMLAEWLTALGCRVTGSSYTAEFSVSSPSPRAPAAPPRP